MKKKFNQKAVHISKYGSNQIYSFISEGALDIDIKTVASFGEEWSKFSNFSDKEIKEIGNEYFDILPNALLIDKSYVLDVGCGTGRWSRYLADKVGFVECIDPSDAVYSAAELLKDHSNIRITKASVGNIPFPDNSFDLVMSIGVLHHIPDTKEGIGKCVKKIKEGGFFYTYLYYALDNRNFLYRLLFKASDLIRFFISKFPSSLKKTTCEIIAFGVYLPLIFLASVVKILFGDVYKVFPLSYYVGKSLNVIRNDALDRFGTPLERRFSKSDINTMLQENGLTNIKFSDGVPYWHVIAQKPTARPSSSNGKTF